MAERTYPIETNNIPADKLSTYDWKGMFKANSKLSKELTRKYEEQVRIKHKLTKEQFKSIGEEGGLGQWPME